MSLNVNLNLPVALDLEDLLPGLFNRLPALDGFATRVNAETGDALGADLRQSIEILFLKGSVERLVSLFNCDRIGSRVGR